MDQTTFMYLLSNQQKWAEEFKKQKKIHLKEYNDSVKDKRWYGNSKEYKELWVQKGSMFHK
jgi:hypothetical protein